MVTEEERARRRRMMAEAAERMDRRAEETAEILRRRLADKIQASVEQAGEATPIEEALALLRSVGPLNADR